jgi:hypothetical protein
MNQKPSSNTTKIIIVTSLLGLGILLLVVILALAFRGNIMQMVTPETPTQPFPTLFVPTPDCGLPTLLLGTSSFQIQNLTPAQDGSWIVPAHTSSIAYWVQGTDTNPVFVISPTPQNLTVMSTTSVGTTAKVTWKNCNSSTYNLSAPQAGSLDIPALLSDQSMEGVTVFFETDPSGAGFVYTGELTEQQISTINTPAPSDVQAEISLLETTISQDGASIQISISINNYGTSPITLSTNDVSVVQADSTPLTMISSKPALPKQIEAGKTETINLTFPKPNSPTATLKVFTVEYDIEGY